MLLLLPPSERKAPAPRRGRPTDLHALTLPSLAAARGQVRDALIALGDDASARATLGVSDGLAAEVAANPRLQTAPARPAMELFTGVLYEALDWAGLDASTRRRASTRLLVASALYGVLAPGDRAAGYRLSMDVDLPGVGPLAAFWRGALSEVLQERAEDGGVLVDCRSATYAAAWRPRGAVAGGGVAVRVLREHEGRRTVVSHDAKHTRGLVARHLLCGLAAHRGRDPRDAEDVAHRLADRWTVELGPAPRGAGLRPLDVVLT
ncbi:MAG: peroxide stress protein YaaA [Kineosporiaceae bacterium]